ncbi:MAG: HAMP domain-containing histidine kinase [Bacteroidales bacterium]|jgi:nitrogen fixation/metabolism regulation signal transduction histidine kinase|nr:HAMP domain-containing histidine kinase [Bacteroidales bacterium]
MMGAETNIGTLWIALGGVVIAALTYIVTRAATRRKIIGKIDFMSDALDSGETAFRYSESRWRNRRLNKSLNRLRSIFEAEKADIRERERYFGTMLDHVQSGVIVIDGEKIDYSNTVAKGFLGMAEISSLRQIGRISPDLANAFREASEMESRASFISERGTVQFSVSACTARLHGKEVSIVTFNDITREMENNESESWTRLIRVLTHEIMNTVTPVASLSSALSQNLDSYSAEDIRSALGTIASSSEGLISFVQSYRSLTHISAPVRKAFYLKDLVNDSVNIAKANWPSVNVLYRELSSDVILYADYGQMSQVLNNLIKNAVQAGAGNVSITASIDKREQTVIDIANDGEPISASGQEQLFVPFYTTKGSSGTGVGLSLCRQIVRLNGGTIKLSSSTPEATVFTIVM